MAIGLLKPSLTLFRCCYQKWRFPTIKVSPMVGGNEGKWPFRPNLKVTQITEELIFLSLILSITFIKTLVYYAKRIYSFFPLAKALVLSYLDMDCGPSRKVERYLSPRRKEDKKFESHYDRNNTCKIH